MGQQSPFSAFTQQPGRPQPNAQPGLPATQPTAPQGLPNANPLQQAMQAAAAMDPAMQAKVLQQLMNPNAGDGFAAAPANPVGAQPPGALPENPLMPGTPKELLAGGALGLGIGKGLEKISGLPDHPERNGFVKAAKWVDRQPGLRQANAFLDKQLFSPLKKADWAKELFMLYDSEAEALEHMQQRKANSLVKRYGTGRKGVPAIGDKLSGKIKPGDPKLLENLSKAAQEEITRLDDEVKRLAGIADKTDADKAALKNAKAGLEAFTRLQREADGIVQHYLPNFERLAKVATPLTHNPIGKLFATIGHYTTEVFTGGAMQGMAKGGMERVMKAAAPVLAGAVIFGQAFSRARKAQEGEKVQTFFHDFMGMGLGTFFGWMAGSQILESLNARNLFGKLAGRRFLPKLLKWVPVLGKNSLVGTVLQLAAMFGMGTVFQKIFEGLSHKIFGTPSEESLNPEAEPKPSVHGSRFDRMFAQGGATTPPSAPANTANTNPQAAPVFSVTPDEIRQNRAARQAQQDLEQVTSLPWDESNTLNPFGH